MLALPRVAFAAPAPLVVGYYPYWATQPAATEIRFDRFTHIIHAFITVAPDGTIKPQSGVPSQPLTRAAHAAGVKVILALGGGSNGANFGKMVRDPALSAAFIQNVAKIVSTNGYDGADIDWEYPGEGDKPLLTGFVTSLRAALKADNPNALLVMALPKGNYYGQWYDIDAIKDKLDFVQIMTYDMHGPWSAHSGYNSALYAVKSDPDGYALNFEVSVNYWLKRGFSNTQLLTGIPCYGRGFTAAKWGDKPTGKSPHEEISYKQVPALLAQGWVREWDPQAAVPWLRQDGGTEIISYDDEISATLKGAWSRSHHLGGIFFWDIDQDFIDGDHRIVAAARAGWDQGEKADDPGLIALRATGGLPREAALAANQK